MELDDEAPGAPSLMATKNLPTSVHVSASSSTLAATWPSASTLCMSSPLPSPKPWQRHAIAAMDVDCDGGSTMAPTEVMEFDRFTSIGLEEPQEGSLHNLVEEDLVEAEAALHDVVADVAGNMMLLPVHGGAPLSVSELPDDAVVTIRVFRFFEDQADGERIWERELRNVNSGSLLWLIVHLMPRMHSVAGRKYGQWCTVHHIRVRAGCLRAGYHMAQEGSCPFAKTFGATVAVKGLVTGESLPTGYFWFVSPHRGCDGECDSAVVEEEEVLERQGWRHVRRSGPFDGEAFLSAWRARGASLDEACLRDALSEFVA